MCDRVSDCFSLEWEKTEGNVDIDRARLMTNKQDPGPPSKYERIGNAGDKALGNALGQKISPVCFVKYD
jgi:hypothetical protein